MIVIIFILGLAIGSFINALVWRLHEKRDFVTDRSVCEHCGHTLAAKDLVPLISWLSLSGKCRYCHKPISIKNPVAELLTAGLFSLSYAHWPNSLVTVADWLIFVLWLAIVAVLVGLLLYDVAWLELPDSLMRALFVLVAASLIIKIGISDEPLEIVKDSALGFAYGGGFFYILYQISGGKWIGGGDVKLGFVMGLYSGALASLMALLIGFYSATAFVLPLMAAKKLTRKSKVPFGPFLILGFFIVGIWSQDAGNWLQRTLGL